MLWFLKKLGVDVAGYDRWTLQFAGEMNWLLWCTAAALLTAGVLAWWQVRRRQRPWQRRLLLTLRLALLALIFAMLLRPELELLKTVPLRSQILVGVDRTPSMEIADAAGGKRRIDAVAQALSQESPWKAFAEEHDVRYVLFSGRGNDYQSAEVPRESLLNGYATSGTETDIGSALADLAKRSRERATAAVVLVSDGADHGALSELREDPGGFTDYLKRNDLIPNAPLTTVKVGGEERFPDLAIRRVDADEYGFIRNKVSVKVALAAQEVGAQQVPVSIKLGNEPIASSTASLPAEGGEIEVDLGFSPTRVGEFVYTVEVPVLAGERLTENNRRQFRIKIIRDKVRVLHVVGRPSWDTRFLRRTLKEDPNIDLVSFMILRELVPIPFRENELSLIPFPTDEIFDTKLHTFDLVIFQNFQYMPRYGILHNHLRNVADFVVQDGGGFVMIGGDQSFAAGHYAGTPIAEILPVSLNFSGSLFDEGKSIVPGRFTPQLSTGGRLHPITRLGTDPLRSEEMWKSLPPLDGVNRTGDLVAGAVGLLVHPALKTPGGKSMPVVAAANAGKGRVMSIAADSSWYWHFLPVDGGSTNEIYLTFWREAIRWLTRDPALKQLNISTDRTRYRPSEEVNIEISVLDPEYRPVSEAQVDILMRSLDGTTICQKHADPAGEGRYQAHCQAGGSGYLEIEARAQRGGASLGSDTAYIEVVALSREFERAQPDGQLLELLAELGGGEALAIENGRLNGEIKLREERSFRVLGSKDLPLWDTMAALLLALTLLSLEWWLRRRWGFS